MMEIMNWKTISDPKHYKMSNLTWRIFVMVFNLPFGSFRDDIITMGDDLNINDRHKQDNGKYIL